MEVVQTYKTSCRYVTYSRFGQLCLIVKGVAVEDNKLHSEKITILEYKYGLKGDRGLSNSNITAPIHYM